MGFKEKNNDQINEDQIKLIETAQTRVKQKKMLFYHFSVMIFGNITFLILNLLFEFKSELIFFSYPWSYLATTLWLLLFLIHTYNVFITNMFMGKSWEQEQIKKLISKQEIKITKIKMEFEKEARIKAESEIFNQNNSSNCITLIAAAAENNVIGNDNKLIWHLSRIIIIKVFFV